ncbi:hypothetical protein HLH17_11460 [Acinetobacter sp. ANC 5380]|uniref:Uncharacterized protein n=1 Tax=Acinetobacter terrae TaxID=2731247 RepID=A0A7Y2WBF5_9GAMM|nr:hypothetical protein [Acinetobacter terrae]NNH78275.1 hypothetical protein [Acinetobacter terrae]
MSLAMGAGTGSALLGVCQLDWAFLVSICVALGGTIVPLPISLGILIPAVVALGIWLLGRKNI